MHDDIPLAQRQTKPPSRPPRQGSRRWLMVGLLPVLVLIWIGWPRSQPSVVTAVVTTAIPSPVPTVIASPSSSTPPDSLLGHRPFAEAPAEVLVTVGTYGGRSIQLHRYAATRWQAMVSAAAAEGVILAPISGFRSVADQEYLFFQRAQQRALRPQERALVSAPPGYSEHHTGYAIDIGDGRDPATDTELTFAGTAAFRWLSQHGARFGFELSFPIDNPQGVSYEPWHWRFVGDRASLETFYR